MKHLVMAFILLTSLQADAQTYDWEITPGLFTSWSVYTDSIRISVRSDNLDSFCDRHFLVIQNGMMELSAGNAKASDNTAFMTYRPGYDNCNTLYPGMTGEAVIYQYPGWFHPDKAFSLIYIKNIYALKTLEIQQEPRLSMPQLPASTPDNATCSSFKTKNFFGFPTRNSMQFCAWTGTYGAVKALYFNALVTHGAVTLDPGKLTLSQGENSVTSLSYWADNSTAAVLYCPDCSREIKAGGDIAGVVFELPLWWDWSQPCTLQFQGQDITIRDQYSCAAVTALGSDSAELVPMRRFRDQYLKGSVAGRMLIDLYYRCSPRLSTMLEQYPWFRAAARGWLARLAAALP